MKRKPNLCIMSYFIAGVIFVCGLMNPISTEAASFYVATSGNNLNPGTEAQPFQTVNKGVSVLNPGDTLYIKNGIYREWLDWQPEYPSGTSWNEPVTVKAFPGDTVTLMPNEGSDFVIRFIGTQYVIVNGLILDGTNINHNVVKITWGGTHPSAHHIRIQNSELRNSPKVGVVVGTFSDNNEFINVDIHDSGYDEWAHGIYIKSRNNLIERCRVYRNGGYGIHVFNNSEPGEASNNLVLKNKVYDNARTGNRGYGIILGSGNENKAYNNLIWGNNGGIQINYNGSSNTDVYNNTIYANTGNNGYCIYVGTSSNDSVKNNICWGNSYNVISKNGTGTELSGNTFTDPLFIDANGLDFQLQEGSQCVDAGLAVNGVADDIKGTSRPQGSQYDVGAYEYTGTGVNNDSPQAPKNLRITSN